MKLSVTCTRINIICGVVSFVYYNLMMKIMRALLLVVVISVLMVVMSGGNVRVDARVVHDYGDALTNSILFFEGQRSGKLPPSQRMKWRKDSALSDGLDVGVDLAGGYYDAGDNVKFNFPMAFSTTMLAWSVLEFGKSMGPSDLQHTLDAIRWGTDYLLKATATPGVVYVQVANAYADHNCWERPEDMDTPRTVYSVTRDKPGSEVSAEIAAALAAASILFRVSDRPYATLLFQRAAKVFEFADKYRGSYSDSLGPVVCPFYCDFNGYQDELIWAASWLHKASKGAKYWNYVTNNVPKISATFTEFGWDAKHAGINILVSKFVMNTSLNSDLFLPNADRFVCSILPESPSRSVSYSPGGLLFKPGGSNLQHVTALSFALLVYGRNLKYANKVVHCDNVVIAPSRLIRFAKIQVDYILGSNPAKMSYMVGYGPKYPQKIHHRGSTLPSVNAHPNRLKCDEGSPYFSSDKPNPNLLTGAIVGGPDINDSYEDSRVNFVQSEPTTYINAPFVGVLAYFKTRKSR